MYRYGRRSLGGIVKKIHRSAFFYVVLGMIALVTASQLLSSKTPRATLTQSEFQSALDKREIRTAKFVSEEQTVKGDLAKAMPKGSKYAGAKKYSAKYVKALEESLATKAEAAGVKVEGGTPSSSVWLSLLFNFLPIVLLFGLFLWLMNSMQGGGNRIMQFGKSRAKMQSKDAPKVTFADVAGVDEAIDELREIKEFLESPAKFQAIGAKIPKGVLLYGPPGTGKTLLAKAVAGEAGVPFFFISGSDFVEMFVGVGASRVRDLFEQAKTNAPSIIFVDEIDAVGRHRGSGMGGGHDEREQTLNQMLVEMDGFDSKTGVIMIAATNRPDILDPALLRPGRFDRQISVDLPDLEGRKAIFRVHAKGKPLGPDVDLDVAARGTPGMSGADIANLLNEAALFTARRNKTIIGRAEIDAATDRVMMGAEKRSRVMPAGELENTAYHEAGHALVGHVLEGCDPVHKVTVIPRGNALGVTISLPTEDRYSFTRRALRDRLAMALGGRTAEEIMFGIGNVTTGASNDLEQASRVARNMIMKYGFSEEVGLISLGESDANLFTFGAGARANYSGETATKIDDEVRKFLSEAHRTARAILTTHRDVLETFTRELLKKETLEKEDIDRIFKDLPKWVTEPEEAFKPELLPIDPTPEPIATPELVAARRSALGRVRNRVGSAVRGARDGLTGGDNAPEPARGPKPQPRLQP
jgi:cell division protease FtsH